MVPSDDDKLFYRKVGQKLLSLISSEDHCQKFPSGTIATVISFISSLFLL